MAYQRKASASARLDADVLILPECGSPEYLRRAGLDIDSDHMLWVGDNDSKGLAIIARPPFTVSPLFTNRDELPQWVVPARVACAQWAPIDLLAVWSFNHRAERNLGINPLSLALKTFSQTLNRSRLIAAGDFNHNVNWDRAQKATNFQFLIDELAQHGLYSAYHDSRGCAHGEEAEPTIYWMKRTKHGPTYHIDYVFAPMSWLEDAIVEVGTYEDWAGNKDWTGKSLSDHSPLVCSFAAKHLNQPT
jgi:exodeoxyribonuclease III